MYTTNISDPSFNAALANSFLLISFTRLVVGKASAVVKDLQVSSFSTN